MGGKRLVAGLVAAVVAFCGVTATASAKQTEALNLYDASLTAEQFTELQRAGYDIVSPRPTGKGYAAQLVLTAAERKALQAKGVDTSLYRNEDGLTARQAAARQAAQGYNVWMDYDGPDGIAAWMRGFVKKHKRIAKLKKVGSTLQGRPILAIRLTQKFKGKKKVKPKDLKKRPAELFQGTTHAREWISTEVTRRLIEYFAKQENLLKKNQIWFVPVVNPDGYQYTFDHERLWRKNLRDANGDGRITNLDGVDLNRNYPDHWKYDDEGSSTETSSETYRGDGPGSEPETQANMNLIDKIDPVTAVSYHSYGPLILYPLGWQVQTPVPDDPTYIALSGTDEKPAIEGFDPDLSAELYTTNGEMTDWAAGSNKTLAWTVELNEGCQGCGFVFPDDPALVQREFEINVPFARSLVRTAANPEKPRSHLKIKTKRFYFDTSELDPTRANNPGSDFSFTRSYGDPQPVEVLARSSLRKVQLRYKINGGKTHKTKARIFKGGERYGGGYDLTYKHRRGVVTGTNPGDKVEVWFTAKEAKAKKKGKGKRKKKWKNVRSESFTYEAVSESGAKVLVVANEDYTGISPDQGGQGPSYLSYYTEALAANGIAHDVYDIDATDPYHQGGEGSGEAPDHLGVLSHYDAVVWYTGDDIITREPGMPAGTASRLANDVMLEMRAYLNEGGNLLYTGKNAGVQYQNAYLFDPVANEPCDPDAEVTRCQVLSDDFLQYYLGAYLFNDGGGLDENTDLPFPLTGLTAPFDGLGFTLNGGTSADNQDWANSMLSTSSILPESEYPQFASDAPMEWDDGVAGVFDPIDGSQYVYSDRADQSYKRLTRTITVPPGGATMTFRASYDIESAWDFLFVEARTAGGDDWTTLPDANGHTDQDPGNSCESGWIEEIHPFLAHYQTHNADQSCSPTGTSGEWNAATGRSEGWETWSVDLENSTGSDRQVEVSIAYASDWGSQGAGAFIDDIQVSTGEGTTSFEEDGDPMDGWEASAPPEGSNENPNTWRRTGSVGFEEGAAISTADSLYFGFGLEGITDTDTRNQVLGRSVNYLLNSP